MPNTFKKILVVCRELNSAHQLQSIKPEHADYYIVASDDVSVHKYCNRLPWVKEVCWIEEMESFYVVADEVIRVREFINSWLSAINFKNNNQRMVPDELLFFPNYPEGGMTTQFIQDLLLLIRSYSKLIERNNIQNIIIIESASQKWADEIIKLIAYKNKIKVKVIGRSFFKSIRHDLYQKMITVGRSICFLLNVIRIRYRLSKENAQTNIKDIEIAFQLCSSDQKHIENILPLMNALKEYNYSPIAVCWLSGERYSGLSAFRLFKRNGLTAIALESLCTNSEILKSIWLTIQFYHLLLKNKKSFFNDIALHYQDILLGRLLWPSLVFFVIAEFGHSYLFHIAMKKYFQYHRPLALKLWGATALREGTIAYKSIPDDLSVFIFFYAIGACIEWPYDDPDSPIDLMFAAGEYHKRMINKSKYPISRNIQVCGQARYEGIAAFQRQFKREHSLNSLGIQDRFSLYVLFDSGFVLRGYMTQKEQILSLSTILDIIQNHPNIALLIKPHPRHKVSILEKMIHSNSSQKNVFLLNKDILPYHALNVADTLITKYSTLGVEAMLFECPVISVILDGEKRFGIYETAAEYFYNPKKLYGFLNKIASDRAIYQKWRSSQIKKQKQFLPLYFKACEISPSKLQAKLLYEYLSSVHPRIYNVVQRKRTPS